MKKLIALATVLALSVTPAFAADTATTTGEYQGLCATGIALGKEVKTDCKINWTDATTKKTYCFSSEAMKTEWAKDTTKHIKMADENFAKHHASTDHGTEASKHM